MAWASPPGSASAWVSAPGCEWADMTHTRSPRTAPARTQPTGTSPCYPLVKEREVVGVAKAPAPPAQLMHPLPVCADRSPRRVPPVLDPHTADPQHEIHPEAAVVCAALHVRAVVVTIRG